jgi:hypothetical protein
MMAALRAPEVVKRFAAPGIVAVGGMPEFPAYHAQESARWGEFIRARNIQIQ